METIDFVTRQRRRSCKADIAQVARVADYLSSVGFYWPIVSAQDHPATAPLHELHASYNHTVKHVQSETVMGERMAASAIEMARVLAGNEVSLRQRPPLSLLVCTIAPLAQDKEGMESALAFAAAGLPVGFMSMANTGSTAPATIAGTLVAGDAEIVAAMVLDPDGLSRRADFPFSHAGLHAPAHRRLPEHSLGGRAALCNWC